MVFNLPHNMLAVLKSTTNPMDSCVGLSDLTYSNSKVHPIRRDPTLVAPNKMTAEAHQLLT